MDGFEWFWIGILHKNFPFNVAVPQGSVLSLTLFLLYISDTPDVVSNIAIHIDDTTLYSSVTRHLMCGNN